MKLAEALILRADAQTRIAQLRERLNRSARVQEGEKPPENPAELLTELERTIGSFTALVKQINRTNAASLLRDGLTMTDALAERDSLALRRNALDGVVKATAVPDFRYGRSEIKYVTTVDIVALQRQVDDLARQYRELDTQIQQANWAIDVITDR